MGELLWMSEIWDVNQVVIFFKVLTESPQHVSSEELRGDLYIISGRTVVYLKLFMFTPTEVSGQVLERYRELD